MECLSKWILGIKQVDKAQKQIEILTRMSNILVAQCDPFWGAFLKITVNKKEEFVEKEFYKFDQKGKLPAFLQGDESWELTDLAYELQDVMFEHTGGRWKWFTLELDKDGKAKTHFEY